MLIEGKISTHIIKERNAESIQQDAKRETKKGEKKANLPTHPHTRLTWNSPRCSLEAGGFRAVSEIRKCHTHLRSRRRVARSGREIRSPETDVKKRRKRGRGRRGSGCLFLSRWQGVWACAYGYCIFLCQSIWLFFFFSIYLSVYLCISLFMYLPLYLSIYECVWMLMCLHVYWFVYIYRHVLACILLYLLILSLYTIISSVIHTILN